MSDIYSSQQVRIEQPAASVLQRCFAFFIDCLCYFAIGYLGMIITITLRVDSSEAQVFLILAIVFWLFLPLWQELLFQGKTLGKFALGIRVVNVDGTAPKAWAFVLRFLMLWVDLYFSFGLGFAFMMGTKRHQRIGDLLAGTFVIVENEHRGLHSVIREYAPVADDYQPRFAAIGQLTSRQASLIDRAIRAKIANPNELPLESFCAKVNALLGGRLPDESEVDYLKAVLFEYRHHK